MSTRRTSGRSNSTRAMRVQAKTERNKGGAVLVGTTISFTSPATIGDSANGLARFVAGQRIEVRGSAKNSRVFTVATSSASALTVLPAVVTTEAATPQIVLALAE